MLVGNLNELIEPLKKPGGVFLPQQIVQENADAREAKALCPAEFLVDLLWIKRIRLKHLELIDGAAGSVVAADGPWLLRVPGVGPVSRPGLRFGAMSREHKQAQYGEEERSFHDRLDGDVLD